LIHFYKSRNSGAPAPITAAADKDFSADLHWPFLQRGHLLSVVAKLDCQFLA